ncbi:hypothetical protein BLOT_009807 [Blomia tropicalis]|nr:hypothetical protein BLOT_009807 [Blomia tropicalis]
MENLRDQDFKAKITKTWNKGIYDRDTLKALETELIKRVEKTEDQDETDKWDNYLGLVMAMEKCLTCRENALHLYSKLDAPPEKNNEDQDRDNQGEQNNPPIVNYYEPLHHVARSIKPFESDFGKWSMFRNLIENSILSRRDATPEAKNRTIYGLLEGEARSTWTEATCSGETIEQCWKRLKDVFENPTRINAFIQKKILDMKFVKDKFDTFALEKILSQLIELNSTLESLDGDYLGRSSSVLWQIADLFWVQESERMYARCPTLKSIIERIRELHTQSIALSHRKKRHDPSQSKPKVREVRAVSSVQATPRNNVVARVKKCFLCENEGHKAVFCRSTMSADDKKKRINEQRLCLYCLWPGHASIACRRMNQIKCNSCQGNHPTSLHGIANDGKLISVQAVNFVSIDTDEKIDLFEEFIGKTKCKVLLDSRAQLSVISKDLATLGHQRKVDPIYLRGFDTDMIRLVDDVTDVVLIHPEGETAISAYVSDRAPPKQIIIGKDYLFSMFKEGHRVWNTVFGKINLETMRMINVIQMDPVEKEDLEVEDVEEPNLEVKRLESGRFQVKLPFFSDIRPPNNYGKVLIQLKKLQVRLRENNLFQTYEDELLKFLKEDHAELSDNVNGYFIPHREIIRPEAVTTKMRIVLNASYGSTSLNDLLWKGESLGLNVLPHLIRIRTFKYLVIADLQKAFLQIIIDERHRKYLKFLWIKQTGEQLVMQMKVLPFGVICAPAILTNIVAHLIQTMSKGTREALEHATYMDDLLVGHDSETNLRNIVYEARKSFEEAGFQLHKFHTNSIRLAEDIASMEDCKLLGMSWHCRTDEISVNWKIMDNVTTKRDLLALIGKCFDPLGIFDPVKLGLRLLFAKTHALNWDDELEESLIQEIKSHVQEIDVLSNVQLKRKLDKKGELYCFCDASFEAYGYVIYMDGDIVYGKSRVAPMRGTRTIVDLELLALYESAKMVDRIVKYLEYHGVVHMFSDSKINLDRLKLSPNEFPIAIARRLLTILTLGSSFNARFKHISGKNNPADGFSRGVNPKQYLKEHIWALDMPNILKYTSEPIATKTFFTVSNITATPPVMKSWFHSLRTLPKMVKWVDRIMKWMEKSLTNRTRRRDSFHTVILVFQRSESKTPDDVHDNDGLLRCKSRILEYEPIWIPKGLLAEDVLRHAHVRSLHRGIDMSLAMISSDLYIPGSRRIMKKIVRECIKCRILRNQPISQPLGPLHEQQIKYGAPFEDILLDVFGPLKLRNGKKCYGLMVVCRATRAVRIRVLEDLSKTSLYDTMMSLWGQTGFPINVWSDNGTNFVAVLQEVAIMTAKGLINPINWKKSIPSAPWMNGGCERMIRVAKECLSILPNSVRSLFELQRRFINIEYIINQRPILQQDGYWYSPFELSSGRKSTLAKEDKVFDPVELFKFRSKQTKEIALLWMSQYLRRLSTVSPSNPTPIRLHDWVMIPKQLNKRIKWPLAQIIECRPGSDGVVRSVKLDMNNNQFWRPTNGLVWIAHSGGENCY